MLSFVPTLDSLLWYFFAFCKGPQLFTAVFYRVMKSLLDASGAQSLLKCVLFVCFYEVSLFLLCFKPSLCFSSVPIF